MDDFIKAYGKGLLWLVGVVGAVFAYRFINLAFDKMFPPEEKPQLPAHRDPLGVYAATQAARQKPLQRQRIVRY